MIRGALLQITISLAAAASLIGSAAFAQDSFNVNIPQSGVRTPSGYVKPPVELWFDSFDKELVTHFPTDMEKVTLNAPFGSPPQLERVILWTNTAATVAKRYHQLAHDLRAMPLIPQMTGDAMASMLVAYKRSLADWYDDSAAVLEDYIKPRQPARTMEELQSQLAQMTQRSEQQKESMQHLAEMDSKLRDHFHVHPLDDAVWNYAKKPLPKNP